MKRNFQLTILFRASCCLLAMMCLCLCDGCGGGSGKGMPKLSKTVKLGPKGVIKFPGEPKTDSKDETLTGPKGSIRLRGAFASMTRNDFEYEATCVWVEPKPEKELLEAQAKGFVTGRSDGASKTLSNGTVVTYLIGMNGGRAYSERNILSPDGRIYNSTITYPELSEIPTREQIKHEKAFHNSMKVGGWAVNDGLGDRIDELFASRANRVTQEAERRVAREEAAKRNEAQRIQREEEQQRRDAERAAENERRREERDQAMRERIGNIVSQTPAGRRPPPFGGGFPQPQEPEPQQPEGQPGLQQDFGREQAAQDEAFRRNMAMSAPPNPENSIGMSMVGKAFYEETPNNDVLVGFAVTLKKAGNDDSIESIQPLYRTSGGRELKRGTIHGSTTGESKQVYAPEGYAIGAINGHFTSWVQGFELVCMKIKPDGSLDPNDTKTLPWVGHAQSGIPKSVNSRGKPITAIKGFTSGFLSSLELIFDGSQKPDTTQPNPTPPRGTTPTPPRPATPGPMNFANSLGNSRMGAAFSEATPENFVLVGFAVTLKPWGNNKDDSGGCIESLQPLYRSTTGTATKRGTVHGNTTGTAKQVYAPPGYAVGAINGRAVAVVDGFELVCMKVKPDGSLDPNDTKTSPWVGNNEPGARSTINGQGKPITEIKGYTRDHVSSLEFVF